MSRDKARLLDILDWAQRAILEAAGRTRADFDSDENFFFAKSSGWRLLARPRAASPWKPAD